MDSSEIRLDEPELPDREFPLKLRVNPTQTVVSIVGQIESIIASAAIVAWYVGALMYTTAIVLQVTFINI